MGLISVIIRLNFFRCKKFPHLVCYFLFAAVLLCGCNVVPDDKDSSSEQLQEKIYVPDNTTANQIKSILSGPELKKTEPNEIFIKDSHDDHAKVGGVLDIVDVNDKPVVKKHAPAFVERDLYPDEQSQIVLEPQRVRTFGSDTSNQDSDVQEMIRSDSIERNEELALPEPGILDEDVPENESAAALPAGNAPVISRGILKPIRKVSESHETDNESPIISFINGDDVLELSLPERIELVQLIDLVGEYLHLDCIYEPEKIRDHVVVLKLHSKLQSELRVKDLYSLLETVLKSKGFVMTRQEGNLVTIVPAVDALTADPEFVDPNTRDLRAGNMVVTRIFELQHVDVTSVTNLLQNMKLGVTVSPVEETQTLFVTCYANRMSRIERLVDMVDRLGRPREFRYRQLKYTAAGTLAQKIVKLAAELQSIPIVIGLDEKEPSTNVSLASQRIRDGDRNQGTRSTAGQSVYLDTDYRTNRILMIGYNEQLETVEGLIDILDIPQQDMRIPETYNIENLDASLALEKLQELEAIGQSNAPAGQSRKVASSASSSAAGAVYDDVLTGEPCVVVLETTNQLLVNASRQQHTRIKEFLNYIDVSDEDLRTLEIYKIEYVEAEEVTRKLGELGIISVRPERPLRINSPRADMTAAIPTDTVTEIQEREPRVVVIEQTNSIMVNAAPEQHYTIATIIGYLDSKTEEIPYQFYPLENQSPMHLAAVLQNLIQETVRDKEDKIIKVPTKEEEIKIVPDPNTFSLIVYASKKNQEWIAALIEKLDKRRPQVLIDVALVEVSRTDEFDLDLQLATKWPKLEIGGQMSVAGSIVSPFVGRTGEAFSSPRTGTAQGFYSDDHIQALLSAIQTKSYGRVLAKPKILVNDGQPGTIKTVDKTSVKIESIIIPEEGTQRTTTDFREYEAGITLTITPNISEGDLLLLQVQLDRTDFLQRADISVPPDTTASNINTIVTVPDGRTIILGGLLKLNQTKGGTKVPLLGDIPFLGGIFRSTSNKDNESRLYVFLKANILRPDETAKGLPELEKISEKNRAAFETFEGKSQQYEDWPGVESKPMDPLKVLDVE